MTRKCHVRFVRELGSEMGPAYLPDRGDPQQHSRQEDRFPLLCFRIPEKYCYNGRAIGGVSDCSAFLFAHGTEGGTLETQKHSQNRFNRRVSKEVWSFGMMKAPERKPVLTAGLFALILGCMLLPGIPREASGEEDLSKKVADAGKSIEKSVDHAAKKTGAYLKSDSFHREVKRVVDGAAEAIRNAGNWAGSKIDSMSKKDPPKH